MEQSLTQLSPTQTSLAALLPYLQPQEREQLSKLVTEARKRWSLVARPKQRTPPGDWIVWLILAGRGFGKTRTGAEDVRSFGMANAGARIGIIAPTFADARDTCIEGESGLLNIMPHNQIARWNRSMGELVLTNETRYRLFSAEEPDRLRGPQHHRLWGDEPGAWKYAQETYDMAMLGLRLGPNPQFVLTGTPKPKGLIRDLVQRAGKDVHLTRGSTYENRENLSPAFITEIVSRYEGTRLGRQELEGELLEDVEGALWTRDMIERNRRSEAPEKLKRVSVGVDPAVTATEGSAETGIVVAALGYDGHYYVLADRSKRALPAQWAAAVVNAYHDHKADIVVGEGNNGGELVRTVIQGVDKNVPVRIVHASRGKITRAEPVSMLYEQDKVHHVGAFPALEDEMCSYVPGEDSPDHMDALVWAITELRTGGGTGA